jgi:hypothetical protein
MKHIYLHQHPEFHELLKIIADSKGIQPTLVEKDYWIMHVLYGLKKNGLIFELKGGTSLSKGYNIIHRFSEDIDIHIHPPAELEVEVNPKKVKERQIRSRKLFYDWLAENINIEGIIQIKRDTEFDDDAYRSGGIRLLYQSITEELKDIKSGVLLEAGFDTITPNNDLTISSWALDFATEKNILGITNNKATDIPCYHPGYTLIEKLQTIVTKFRKEMEGTAKQKNYLRQYYDIYCLLNNPDVQNFIGTHEYQKHKKIRFSKIDLQISLEENKVQASNDPIVFHCKDTRMR